MQNIDNILSLLTLEEKASLCSGLDFWHTKQVKRLGIPSVMVSDGPHGLRKENNEDDDNVAMKMSYPATSFPPAVNLASTWNPSLIKKMGAALADQCKDQQVSTILGPGTNIKRSPLCGRNFEYFSEDPFLAGEMCVAYINGAEENNIGTSLKHFAANSQEYLRFTINSIIDERSLRELYLAAFETAVKKAQPWTVMHSYNKLNGCHMSDNKRLLNDILRNEWGYEGMVISDWNALNNRVAAIAAGMDLEMPSSGGRNDKLIVKAVKDGELSMEQLDACVKRVLEFVFKCESNIDENYKADYEAAHKLAKSIADESIVLLKNEENLLPLAKEGDIAIIGALAKHCRYQGSGSSHINPYKLVNFTDRLDELKVNYTLAEGYVLDNDNPNEQLINEAVELAKNSQRVILCVGLTEDYEQEAIDRLHMCLPESHNKLAEAVLAANPNAVVLLMGGAPVELPWADNAKSIVNAYLAGEACGESIYDIIFGNVNPSGKLAETYPIKLSDFIGTPFYRMGPKNVEHREGIFIGYRYYDTAKKNVRFPFGHGLSYTKFEYSDLVISADKIKDSGKLTVSATITNVGDIDGAEVVQLYVKDIKSTIFRPEKELKGFKKVFLKAGKSVKVEFKLDKRSFAYYNVNINDWHVESGNFEIMLAASSRDIRLNGVVEVESTNPDATVPDYTNICPVYYNLDKADTIPFEEFAAIYGGRIPSNSPSKRGEFDQNTTMGELRCCIAGRITYAVAPMFMAGQMPNADMTTMILMKKAFLDMPMRALNGITTGLLDTNVTDGIIMWGNKHRLKGLGRMIKGLFISLGNIRRENHVRELQREKKRLRDAQKLQIKELKDEKLERIDELKTAKKELKESGYNKDELAELKNTKKEFIEEHKETLQSIKTENKTVLKELSEDLKDIKKNK